MKYDEISALEMKMSVTRAIDLSFLDKLLSIIRVHGNDDFATKNGVVTKDTTRDINDWWTSGRPSN